MAVLRNFDVVCNKFRVVGMSFSSSYAQKWINETYTSSFIIPVSLITIEIRTRSSLRKFYSWISQSQKPKYNTTFWLCIWCICVQPSCHKEVFWSGDNVPRFLNLGTTWARVVNFKLRPLHPHANRSILKYTVFHIVSRTNFTLEGEDYQ